MSHKRYICPFLLFLMLSVSCSGLSKNIRNGSTQLLRAVGREGELVGYANVERILPLIEEISDQDISLVSRFFYDVIFVTSGSLVYGVIEGDIPYVGRVMIADKLNAVQESYNGIEYFVTALDGNTIYFDLVSSGVILFSTSQEGFLKSFDIFVKNKENIMTESFSLLLQSASLGFYGKYIDSQINKLFEGGKIKNLVYLIDKTEKGDEFKISGLMQMKDADVFRTANVYLSDMYVKDLKKIEKKIEIKEILTTLRINRDKNAMEYYGFTVPLSLMLNMIDEQKSE